MFVSEGRPLGRARSALLAGSNCLELGYGRFMQTDPLGYDDGLNWYNYVAGDPINHVDSSGTLTCVSVVDYTYTNPFFPETSYEESHLECSSDGGGEGSGGNGGSPGGGGGGGGGGQPAPIPAPMPMPQKNNCWKGKYKTYALGGSATLALFGGINVSVSFGVSIPENGDIGSVQFFGGGQAAGMLGIGGFAGAGATFSKGTNSGLMSNFDRGGFAYGEADAGLGFAVGGSLQGNRTSSSGSVGLPIPKVGAGYGAYAGVGAGYGATAATTPFCAL